MLLRYLIARTVPIGTLLQHTHFHIAIDIYSSSFEFLSTSTDNQQSRSYCQVVVVKFLVHARLYSELKLSSRDDAILQVCFSLSVFKMIWQLNYSQIATF